MSLLDSDSKVIDEINKKGKKRKTRTFRSLNKFAPVIDSYKEKEKNKKASDDSSDGLIPETKESLGAKKSLTTHSESNKKLKIKNTEVNSSSVKKALSETKFIPEPIRKEAVNEADKVGPANEEQLGNEIGNVLGTNKEQSGNKTGNVLGTNKEQSGNKTGNVLGTNKEQLGNETRNETGNSFEQQSSEDSYGFAHDVDRTDPRRLTGQKLILLNVLFEDCHPRGTQETRKFTAEFLADKITTSKDQVRTQLKRLVKEGYLYRLQGRAGRNGWMRFKIPVKVFNILAEEQRNLISTLKESSISTKLGTKQGTEQGTKPPSSSSNNINITTSTKDFLPQDWKSIQIPVELKAEGFSMAHVKQLYSTNAFTATEIQESFDNFCYDLKNKLVTPHRGAIAFFMGILRKNKSVYESRKYIALRDAEIKEYERKKAESEEALRQLQEFKVIAEFEAHWNKLTIEQRNKVVPPSQFIEEGSEMQEKIARGHYLENKENFLILAGLT